MLTTVIIILLLLWVLGAFGHLVVPALAFGGSLIHLLLVIVIVLVIIEVLRRRG